MKTLSSLVPLAGLWFVVAAVSADAAEDSWTLASPDGQLVVTLALTAPPQVSSYPADQARLYYRIEQGRENQRVEVLPWSPLGLQRSDESFVDGLRLRSRGEAGTIDETYTLLHGKRSRCHSLARQQSWLFENPRGAALEVVFRVANDGVAFRYGLPGAGHRRTDRLSSAR
jgi:alpha-glucosidase